MNKRLLVLAVMGWSVYFIGWGSSANGTIFAQQAASLKKTHIYRTVENHPIRLDVYHRQGKLRQPVLMRIHGGALIFGHRGTSHPEQIDLYLNAGYTVVSIDYRLAPESKLPKILEDLEAAYRWVQQEGPCLYSMDGSRIAVVGHSAGGYLTLISGYRLQPRPKALVSFYGYGDIIGDWYTRPSATYLKMKPVSKKEAYAATGKEPISEALSEEARWPFYLYCRQNGQWPWEVVGIDPARNPSAFIPFCPLKNVGRDFPPTLLLHGTNDEDVPFEQSSLMAREMERKGVPHELVVIKNGAHGFDDKWEDPQVQAAFQKVLAFLKRHLGSQGNSE